MSQDRFGNPIAPGLPYARGSIVESTSDDLQKLNGILRYSQGDARNGLSVTAMGYDGQWNATDQVPQRALDSGRITRFGNIDPTDGGQSSRVSLSGSWFLDRDAPPAPLRDAMSYSLLAPGKRLRPILVFMAAHAAGGTQYQHRFACF